MRTITEAIVVQKKIPGHPDESTIAKTTVTINIITSIKILQTILVVKLPLKKNKSKLLFHYFIKITPEKKFKLLFYYFIKSPLEKKSKLLFHYLLIYLFIKMILFLKIISTFFL